MSSPDTSTTRSASEKASSKRSKRGDSGSKPKKVNFQYFSTKELTQMLLTGKTQDALQYLRSLPEKDLENVRQRLIRNIQKIQQKAALTSPETLRKDNQSSTSLSGSQASNGFGSSDGSSSSSPGGSISARSDGPYLRNSTNSLTTLGGSALMQAFSANQGGPPSPAPKRTSTSAISSAPPSQQSLSTLSASERANIELAGKYKIGEVLGKGGFGTVLKAVSFETGAFVAIKQIDKELVDDSQLPSVMKEAEILKRLNHPNIEKIFGIIETKTSLYFVLEFVESGSLASLVKKYGVFPEPLIAIYVFQTLKGLDYLHSCNIIHRDIKGDNILITKDGKVKLADFGTAKFEDNEKKSQNVVGTPYWMAPEVIEMLPTVGPASDIWSLGCTVVELLTGAPPYFDLGPMTALFKIVEDQLPPFPQGISEELNDFLTKCFDRDAAKRPTAKLLLDHGFMKQHIKPDSPILDLEQATGTIRMHNQDTLRRRPAVFEMAWGAPPETPKPATAPALDAIRTMPSSSLLMRRPSVRLPDPIGSTEEAERLKRDKERLDASVETLKRQLGAVKQDCERLSKEEQELLAKLDSQYSTQSTLQKKRAQLSKLLSLLSGNVEDLKIVETALESLNRRFGQERIDRVVPNTPALAKSRSRRRMSSSSSSPTLRRSKSSENL